ncbi:class I SAM-dependent methyltransferase [Klebsiella pneumoniae]|nr:class I SAM-dependent methyltransferase [Klebsiella pneumoniae]
MTRGSINISSPNGCLPSVHHIAEASEKHFVMEDWHNFGADYDTTLMAWYERFLASWPEVPITILSISNACLPII